MKVHSDKKTQDLTTMAELCQSFAKPSTRAMLAPDATSIRTRPDRRGERESYNSARERCTKENGNGERQKGGAAVITIYLEETRLNMARVKF